jgi:hypothetical protein
LIVAAPAAHATNYEYVSGVDVSYWSYDGAVVGTNAAESNPITGTIPDATFFYTGPVNWVYLGSQSGPNLVSTFLNVSDVTGFSSPSGKFGSVAAFGASSLSDAGDSNSAFFSILGAGTFSAGYVTHDDGATMYVDNFSNLVVNSPGETTAVTNFFSTNFGPHEYLVTYVEGNGAPSVLQVATNAPEPATWAMMGLGFMGLAFAGYRKARKTPAFAA